MLSPASRTLPKKVASASVLFDWTSPSFASRFSTIAATESSPSTRNIHAAPSSMRSSSCVATPYCASTSRPSETRQQRKQLIARNFSIVRL